MAVKSMTNIDSAVIADTRGQQRLNSPMGSHEHANHDAGWGMAARATLHCLTGCAIGEVLGMVIGTALGWGNAATMALAIVLAFIFGYGLTLFGIRKAGLGPMAIIKVALAADTISIVIMEITDNGVLLLIPGAMDATIDSLLFWAALAVAFVVAFVMTVPVNKWLIGKGKGHAVVHGLRWLRAASCGPKTAPKAGGVRPSASRVRMLSSRARRVSWDM